MAVPSLPTALNTNDVVNDAWVDAVYDGLEWHRDTKAIFEGEAWNGNQGAPIDVATATNTTFGFGSSGAFYNTPDQNVGTWTTKAADSDPESLVVPTAGLYLVFIHASWEANASGRRQTSLIINGSVLGRSRARIEAASSSLTEYSHSVLADLAASDELDIDSYQDSGNTLELTAHLTAIWQQST